MPINPNNRLIKTKCLALTMKFYIPLVLKALMASTALAHPNLRHSDNRGLSLSLAGVYFDSYSSGDVITSLAAGGITVEASKRVSIIKDKWVPGQAMIFDSSAPTGDDYDLGTPNSAYGGPGIGNAGNTGLYLNQYSQGNVLIVSEDEDSSDPDDNKKGGKITLLFNTPTPLTSVGLLDNDEGTILYVETADGGSSTFSNGSGGNNSYEDVAIGKPDVVKLEVFFQRSGAIANVLFSPPYYLDCVVSPYFNIQGHPHGTLFTSVVPPFLTVTTMRRTSKNGPLVPGIPMLFDSANPTNDDYDLGTPHKTVGGPGIGKAGRPDQLFPNLVPKGNVLIISEDDISPDDNQHGGIITIESAIPFNMESIGILDNDEGIVLDVYTSDGGVSSFENFNGGNNSFELMAIHKPSVTKLVINFLGSGAITEVNSYECGFPE